MPPKRKVPASDEASVATHTKKSKTIASEDRVLPQPTNKVLPATISFPAKSRQSIIRIASWNVCVYTPSYPCATCPPVREAAVWIHLRCRRPRLALHLYPSQSHVRKGHRRLPCYLRPRLLSPPHGCRRSSQCHRYA